MSRVHQIETLLSECTSAERLQVFKILRKTIDIHPFENKIRTKAEVILAALDRATDLTIRGVRGIIAEATFVTEVASKLSGWNLKDESATDERYDALLEDSIGLIKVQVKLQRKEKGEPVIRGGFARVEVQKTRTGEVGGIATRPYKFDDFDVLAVCLEPSTHEWTEFRYTPAKWLKAKPNHAHLIDTFQAVSLTPDDAWSDSFQTCIERLRSGLTVQVPAWPKKEKQPRPQK